MLKLLAIFALPSLPTMWTSLYALERTFDARGCGSAHASSPPHPSREAVGEEEEDAVDVARRITCGVCAGLAKVPI